MQSLISNGCVEKYYLYVVLIRNNIRCINNIQEMELYKKKCHKWIDVDFRKIQKQISSNLDYSWRRKTWYKIWLQINRENKLLFIRTDPAPPLHWRGWLVYPDRLCRSGRLRLSFLYRLLTLTRGPDTIFSELKLASLKYYTP
jgi:hypothetical protein